jgi:hypothetical protein
MAKYDRQLIVAFLADDQNQSQTLVQAQALNEKERAEALETEIVTIPPLTGITAADNGPEVEELRRAMSGQLQVSRPITDNSRVYLVGDGNWRLARLSGRSPENIADLLACSGMTAVKVVSIVADGLGRGDVNPIQSGDPEFPDSFAARFHRRLKEAWHIRTVVHARVLNVTVISGPGADRGRKTTAAESETQAGVLDGGHHRTRNKVKVSWENGKQTSEWAY